jgi:hypothetical protein
VRGEESREQFEQLINELYNLKYKVITDYDDDGARFVLLKRYTVHVTLKLAQSIDFDVYADLSAGIYEIGDLHNLTRNMLNVKKIALAYHAREMNTTERLYPSNRQGEHTTTSGL